MSKGSHKVAKKYARALLEAVEPSALEGKQAALEVLAGAWSGNAELRAALTNPALPLADRAAALKSVASRISPNDEKFLHFSAMLLDANRLDSLPAIAQAFAAMVMELRKVLAVKVTSAFAPAGDEKEQLKSKLEKEFGKLASVEWEVDKNLIGGARVQLGDRLLDGSVRGALDKMQAELLSV